MSANQLADEIEKALNKYLSEMRGAGYWYELERARKNLEQVLWDNKAGIVAYLRKAH